MYKRPSGIRTNDAGALPLQDPALRLSSHDCAVRAAHVLGMDDYCTDHYTDDELTELLTAILKAIHGETRESDLERIRACVHRRGHETEH